MTRGRLGSLAIASVCGWVIASVCACVVAAAPALGRSGLRRRGRRERRHHAAALHHRLGCGVRARLRDQRGAGRGTVAWAARVRVREAIPRHLRTGRYAPGDPYCDADHTVATRRRTSRAAAGRTTGRRPSKPATARRAGGRRSHVGTRARGDRVGRLDRHVQRHDGPHPRGSRRRRPDAHAGVHLEHARRVRPRPDRPVGPDAQRLPGRPGNACAD